MNGASELAVEGATDGEGAGVGRLQKQLEREREGGRERERGARVKERKSQTFPNGLEMWKYSDVILVDSKVRRGSVWI